MNSMNQSTTRASPVVAVALACFVVLPNAPRLSRRRMAGIPAPILRKVSRRSLALPAARSIQPSVGFRWKALPPAS
jgi:hypothetical protein